MKIKLQDKMHSKKSKSRNKKPKTHKSKQKSFNPMEYLNSHLDIVDIRCNSTKKKVAVGRDLKIGFTLSTHAPDNTLSMSKFRSKTSQEHYRRPNEGRLKQLLSIDLRSVITQEDNVQFTEVTPRGQQRPYPITSIQLKKRSMPEEYAAIKIQRAWKNHQTFKVVKQYFKAYQQVPVKREIQKIQYRHNMDLQKTLKIKRKRPVDNLQQIDTQTYPLGEQCKTIALDTIQFPLNLQNNSYRSSHMETPIDELQFTSSNHSNHNDILSIPLVSRRQQQNLIEQTTSNKFKQEQNNLIQQSSNTVNKLMYNFQKRRQRAQQDLNQKIESLFQQSNLSEPSIDQQNQFQISYTPYSPQLNPKDFDLNSDDSSINANCYEYLKPEYKMFDLSLQVLKEKKQKDLDTVSKLQKNGKIGIQNAFRKKEKIIGKYEKDKKKTERGRKNYEQSVDQLTRSALSCQKDLFLLNRSKNARQSLRNSFSSQSIVLKSILKQVANQQFQLVGTPLQLCQREISFGQSDYIKLDSQLSEIQTPRVNDNLDSDKLEQEVFQVIVEETVKELFLNDKIYIFIKPFVEDIYQFKKISDQEIQSFLVELVVCYPSEQQILKRVNQKINPTSLQILKIIRNQDYEVDEYELILSETTFRNYRKTVETLFQDKKLTKIARLKQTDPSIKDTVMVQKIAQRRTEKRAKIQKYTFFERDLFIMYMKAVFNALNQIMIQTKSFNTYMNTRSSIGPGQLKLAIKQYNKECTGKQCRSLIKQSNQRIRGIIKNKCSIPSFTNYNELELFQRQISKQIHTQLEETQFRWVNVMDQVLQLWQQVCQALQDLLLQEFLLEFHYY